MSNKALSKLSQLARRLKENTSSDRALKSLVSAGILTENQEFTEPYKHLGRVVTKDQRVRSPK